MTYRQVARKLAALRWDAKSLKAKVCPEAGKCIKNGHREGWTFNG